MAAIRKRGSRWVAQLRRKGYTPLTKTFDSHADAIAWARDQERAIDRAELPTNHRELKSYTVSDLLERYEREITARKRGADQERSKIARSLRAKISIGELFGTYINGCTMLLGKLATSSSQSS